MKVIIVGAGIAGLSAAIGLRRSGHDVVILERSSLAHEVGAAIHVPPNASRILLKWGFDPKRAMLDNCSTVQNFDGLTLASLGDAKDLSFISAKYGAPWFLSHRVDLHNELKLLALGSGIEGKPAELHLKSTVTAIDLEKGQVTLQDGTSLEADLIVAADGVHSDAPTLVNGQPTPAHPTNVSAFRFLIPSEVIREDEESKSLLENQATMRIYIGDAGRRIVWYPCRDGRVQNFVAIFPEKDSAERKEGWNIKSTIEEFLKTYEGFHPQLLKVCKKATEFKVWALLSRDPLEKWHRSRLVLIGDAAHPMLPHQGQGGSQAIEDGAALGCVFSPGTPFFDPSPEALEEGLTLFKEVRRQRASAMQIFSSAGQDEAEKMREKARAFMKVGQKVPTNPGEFYDMNFGYDVFGDCENALERVGKEEGKEKEEVYMEGQEHGGFQPVPVLVQAAF